MKNVVITGSTRGIGLAMALEFLQSGCCVTLSGRGESIRPALMQTLQPFVERYQYIPCDVQNKRDLEALWEAAVAKFGAVDLWINNAGQDFLAIPRIECLCEIHVKRIMKISICSTNKKPPAVVTLSYDRRRFSFNIRFPGCSSGVQQEDFFALSCF